MKKIYFIANLSLLVSTLGVLISYPYRSSLLGGVLNAGFTASLIGGLADWFAIESIFRKPLGINPGRFFRTNIILKDRQKIIYSLATMVQQDLLPKEVVVEKLLNYISLEELTKLLNSEEAKPKLKQTIEVITRNFVSHFQFTKAQNLKLAFRNSVNQNILQNYLSIIEGYLKEDITLLCNLLSRIIVDNQDLKLLLTRIYSDAFEHYEGSNPLRKYLRPFLPSPASLADITLVEMINFLNAPKTISSFEKLLKDYFRSLCIEESETNNKSSLLISDFINYLFASKFKASTPSLIDEAAKFINNSCSTFALDTIIKNHLEGWLSHNYNKMTDLIVKSLEPINDQALVELIEAKVGNELQMIRINGSLVGATVGITIYLINNFYFVGW